MNLRIMIAVATLMGSTSVFSAVTLTAPEEIKIVGVNEREVNSGLIRKKQTYKLDPGLNSISVRYIEFFQHNDNSHDILKSDVVTVKTPELKDGESYVTSPIEELGNGNQLSFDIKLEEPAKPGIVFSSS